MPCFPTVDNPRLPRKFQMQGAPEKRAAYCETYASKRFEEQRRRWDFVDNLEAG